ncbi:MAG: large conductance mechanosensitive channel protein MscL [Actinomycetota bacterium]|nr:large conductance mechanosensitive channel protein MscL [Actinomycetota bacterium]
MLAEFKGFILRGNVVDLAVGIVVGAAFVAVVTSLVENLLTPLIAIPGEVDFSRVRFTVSDSTFHYGRFLNDIISFLLIAAAVFFFVVRPVNALMAQRKTERDVASESKQCTECLSNIPVKARRCAFCSSPQGA